MSKSCRAAAVVVLADLLSPRVAAVTARVNGSTVAVVNSRARTDPVVREEAAHALADAGVDADTIHEVMNGICG